MLTYIIYVGKCLRKSNTIRYLSKRLNYTYICRQKIGKNPKLLGIPVFVKNDYICRQISRTPHKVKKNDKVFKSMFK